MSSEEALFVSRSVAQITRRGINDCPEGERHGRVFKPLGREGDVMRSLHFVCHATSQIGRMAGVKATTNPKTEKVKYASAHDFRRSLGKRWSTRVVPQILMSHMRHRNIETTMRYYVGRNASTTADAVWAAYAKAKKVLFWVPLGKVSPRRTLPPVTQGIMLVRS
jgi:integrase